jgi:RND family efflux transporter MFP subunit
MAESEPMVELTRKRPKRRRWRLVMFIIIVVAAAAGGVWFKWFRGKGGEGARIRTAPVTRGDIERTIDCTGTVAAETGADVRIGSQISGRIKRLYADLDQQVTAGQVIAEIDVPEMRANLEAARRSQDQARARYEQQLQGVGMQHTQVQSAFEQAAQSVRRAQESRGQAISTVSAAKSRLESARAAVEGAQARQRQAEARRRSAQVAVQSQTTQTSTDVQKAQAALEAAEANQTQVEKSADLEVANSQAAVTQAEATAKLAATDLKRLETLLAKGFVSAQAVDTQRTQSEVTAQQLETARSTLQMTREKVAADRAAAKSQVTQAQAALTAAEAGSLQETIRSEDVHSAEEDVENTKSAVSQANLSVQAALADVESAQSQVRSAESDLKSAQAAERAALGNLTQDRLKQQDVKAAYEAMRQSEAQVKNQEAQYQKSFIRSPISGTVVNLTQQEGETVAAQLNAPTLIEVVDLSRLQVDAYVDETDIGELKTGLKTKLTVDAYPDREFPGQITKIASVATVKDNVVTYKVTIGLDQYPLGMLKPQMTADVSISLGAHRNVLLAPSEAIKQRRGGAQVVVLKGGQGEVTPVKTGIADEDSTEILEGVEEGDELVLAGFEQLGIEGFSSAAEVPGFMRQSPFGGPPTGGPKGGAKGGGGAGGGKSGGGGYSGGKGGPR